MGNLLLKATVAFSDTMGNLLLKATEVFNWVTFFWKQQRLSVALWVTFFWKQEIFNDIRQPSSSESNKRFSMTLACLPLLQKPSDNSLFDLTMLHCYNYAHWLYIYIKRPAQIILLAKRAISFLVLRIITFFPWHKYLTTVAWQLSIQPLKGMLGDCLDNFKAWVSRINIHSTKFAPLATCRKVANHSTWNNPSNKLQAKSA
jgi:hypothetical protein